MPMTVRSIVEALGLEVLNQADPDREVTSAYASDLLSDVMAHASPGALWLTLQTHSNVAAVAALKELIVLLVNGRHKVASVNHLENGKKQLEKGHCKQAIEQFDKALEKDPTNFQALYWKGVALGMCGDYSVVIIHQL
jgi:Flp pilus assembly protein TadD